MLEKRTLAAAMIAAAALAGCVAPAGPEAYGPFPENYKEIVAKEMKADFFDPFSLQDVSITQPYKDGMKFRWGWVVCVHANGKNRMGAYAGRQEYGYLINNGEIVATGDQINCSSQKYAEWTEMEMISAKK